MPHFPTGSRIMLVAAALAALLGSSPAAADEITCDDRRLVGRTRIEKGALLFFKGQLGVRTCNVTDVTNRDAGIQTHNSSVLGPASI